MSNTKPTSETRLPPPVWRKVELGTLCDFFTGKKDVNQATLEGAYRFFSCSPNVYYSNEYIYDGAAVIIAGNGSYTGRVAFFSGKFDLYQRTYACVLKPDITASLDYIYYYLYTYFQQTIRERTHGAAIPYIVKADLEDFPLTLPPLPVQRRIAEVLGAYDDAIENNRRRMELLEKMACELYRERFIRRPFVGTARPLGELIVENPKSKIKAREGNNRIEGVPFFTCGTGASWHPQALVDGANLFLNTGGSAEVRFYIGKAAYSTDVWSLTGRPNELVYLYYALKQLCVSGELFTRYFKGATIQHLQKKDLLGYAVQIPDAECLTAFYALVSPMLTAKQTLAQQNIQLRRMRDRLLPRLLSGQLEVRE